MLTMTSDQVYYKLRSIGCSVETSDALAPIVAELSDKKREAFFLWACGMSYREAGLACGFSREIVKRIVHKIRVSVDKTQSHGII